MTPNAQHTAHTPPPEEAQSVDFARALEQAQTGMKKSDRTRTRLRIALCTALNERPAPALKVADICALASVAHGTFYVYFRDLNAALDDVLGAFVEHVQQVMRHATKGRGGERTRAATAAYFDLFDQNPGLMRCLLSGFETFPAAAAAFQRLNHDWARVVAEATARRLAQAGHPPPPNDELMRRAYALGGMVDQYLVALHFNRDAALAAVSGEREQVITTLSTIWQKGMEP